MVSLGAGHEGSVWVLTPQRNWKGDMSSLRGGLGGWTAQQHPVASWDRCGWRPDSPRPVSGSAAHVCRAAPAVSPWPAVGRGASPAVGPVLSRPPRGCLTSPGAHLWPPAAHRSAPVLVPAPQPSSIWSLTGVWPCARAPCVGVLLPLSCLGEAPCSPSGRPVPQSVLVPGAVSARMVVHVPAWGSPHTGSCVGCRKLLSGQACARGPSTAASLGVTGT